MHILIHKFIHFLFPLNEVNSAFVYLIFLNVLSPSVALLSPLTTFVTSLFAALVQRIDKDRILLHRSNMYTQYIVLGITASLVRNLRNPMVDVRRQCYTA